MKAVIKIRPNIRDFRKGVRVILQGGRKEARTRSNFWMLFWNRKLKFSKRAKPISITKKQAMLMQLVNAAVKGEIKAIAALFPYMMQLDMKEEQSLETNKLSLKDEEILQQFLEENKQESKND